MLWVLLTTGNQIKVAREFADIQCSLLYLSQSWVATHADAPRLPVGVVAPVFTEEAMEYNT